MKRTERKWIKNKTVGVYVFVFIFSILCWTTCFLNAFAVSTSNSVMSNITVVWSLAEEIEPFSDKSEKTEKEIEEELYNVIEEEIQGLDLGELQKYVDELNDGEGSVVQRLLLYIKGERFDYQKFSTQILEVLFRKALEIFPAFACIAAIALLSGIVSSLRIGAWANSASDMVFLVSYSAVLIPLVSVLIECIGQTFTCIEEMQRQMQLIYPLMLTLMAASGGTLSAAICRPAVSFFSTAIVAVITSVVLPLTLIIIVFSIAGNFTQELKISKFSDFFKSTNKWIIGIAVSVFGLFFTLQGITAATYDGVVRRAAKYAIGNGIPIVGGFLSGGFDLAIAGGVLIKNALGSLGIFLMISVLFEPVVLLITVNLLLRLTSAATQSLGNGRISNLLSETAGNLHFCMAGLLFTAFLYFISIVLMICASEVLF